eukprot:5079686-Prymnesium_polylepis.1
MCIRDRRQHSARDECGALRRGTRAGHTARDAHVGYDDDARPAHVDAALLPRERRALLRRVPRAARAAARQPLLLGGVRRHLLDGALAGECAARRLRARPRRVPTVPL